MAPRLLSTLLAAGTVAALSVLPAHAFSADWSASSPPAVPAPEEALGFLDDYERARGAPFSPPERACARAALVYAAAYGARCEHSDERLGIGSGTGYRDLLRGLTG